MAKFRAVLLVAAAAGCGGSSSSGTSTAGGPTGAGQTLSIMGFGSGDEIANTRARLATAAVAPAKVKNPSGGFNDQQQVLAGQATPAQALHQAQATAEAAIRAAGTP